MRVRQTVKYLILTHLRGWIGIFKHILAEVADRFLKKGKQVAVEGRIFYRTFEDKKGVTKNMTEIVLDDLVLLGSGKDSSNGKDKEGEL